MPDVDNILYLCHETVLSYPQLLVCLLSIGTWKCVLPGISRHILQTALQHIYCNTGIAHQMRCTHAPRQVIVNARRNGGFRRKNIRQCLCNSVALVKYPLVEMEKLKVKSLTNFIFIFYVNLVFCARTFLKKKTVCYMHAHCSSNKNGSSSLFHIRQIKNKRQKRESKIQTHTKT